MDSDLNTTPLDAAELALNEALARDPYSDEFRDRDEYASFIEIQIRTALAYLDKVAR